MANTHYTPLCPQHTLSTQPHPESTDYQYPFYLSVVNTAQRVAEPEPPYYIDKTQYGKRLRIARQRLQMRQIDLVVALEDYGLMLDQSIIGKIEQGKRTMAVVELAAFAQILEVSVEWLVNGGTLEIQ